MLSDKYLELLRYLDENPLMTFQEIADKTDVTWITAKRRYEELKEKNILHNPVASYNYEKLGLVRMNIIGFTPDYTSLRYVEEACSVHPYTNYRSRFIGRAFGIYIVFFIPDNDDARQNLTEFFDILQNENWIDTYRLMENKYRGVNIYPDLNKLDENTGKWEFNWKSWFEKYNKYTPPDGKPPNGVQTFDLNEITEKLLITLNRITGNASIKQADLIRDEDLQLSRTEAHRIYNFVMDNFITEIENLYDRSKFGLSDLKLFLIDNLNEEIIQKFYHFIKNEPPPYRISIQIIKGNKILLWAQMDQVSAQNLSLELFKFFSHIETYDLVIYQNNSYRWSFYSNNFDFSSKNWKVNREWMVDNPIKELKDKEFNN